MGRFWRKRRISIWQNALVVFVGLLSHSYAAAQTFNCTGAPATFTASATGLYHIVANGAQGGDGLDNSTSGGFGAQLSGDFSLSAGQMLTIAVGCVGGTAFFAGGGGGGSFVVLGVTPLLIAAGGGGAGILSNGGAGNSGQNGGVASGAGGTNGSGGMGGTNFCCNGGGGTGFLSAGGDGSTAGSGGQPYPSFTGGNGFTGGGFGGGGGGDQGGGGGGGGYSGGGGGGANVNGGAGGGGGCFNVGLNQSGGFNVSSNGSVTITLLSQTDAFRVSYASNLNVGDAYVNITNTGASATTVLSSGQTGTTAQNNIDGNICVNIYAFAADEQEVACCSCLVTPNALWSASVKTALLNNTLTPAFPNEVVIKLISSVPNAGPNNTQTCNPATVTATGIASGLAAWGMSLHGVPATTGPTFQMTETPFATSTLSVPELERDVQECQFIQVLGSGQFGICKGCSNAGLGAAAQ